MNFSDLGVPAPLVRSLADRGIDAPFPIQTATLPDTLAGKDVLGRGRTGSGKTLAFALPVVTRLTESGRKRTPSRPRALILAPTRELASQIHATVAPLADAAGLTHTTIFGGVAQGPQVTALKKGIDILVACPGRLEDLIGQKLCGLDAVEVTVLDEADHMADLGFLPVVRRLLDRTPDGGQRMLFSATLDNGVDVLVKRYLHAPVHHSVDPAVAPVSTMTHHVFAVADAPAKREVLSELASGTGRRVLFTRTKHQAKKLAKQLTADGIPAVDLQGNLGQGARERNLAAFTSGDVRVLVATDIAARGIHVDDIELVVHVDPPAEHKAYLHRSGRTARAGSGGVVVTLQLPEQAADVRDLTRKAKIDVRPQQIAPGSAVVAALVGEVAPRVAPAPPAPTPVKGAGKGRKGGAGAVGARTGGRGVGASSGGRGGQQSGGAPKGGAPTSSGSSSGRRRRRGGGGAAGGQSGQGAQGQRPGGLRSGSARSTGSTSSSAPRPQSAGSGSGQGHLQGRRRAGRPQGPAQSGSSRAAG